MNKDIVPSDKNWSQRFNFQWKWNPLDRILNALTSVVDLHLFCQATVAKPEVTRPAMDYLPRTTKVIRRSEHNYNAMVSNQ